MDNRRAIVKAKDSVARPVAGENPHQPWHPSLPEEETILLQRVTLACATEQKPDGRFGISRLRPGFGLELDLAALRNQCTRWVAL